MQKSVFERFQNLVQRFAGATLCICCGSSLALAASFLVFAHWTEWSSSVSSGLVSLYGNPGTLVIAGGGDLPESIPQHFRKLAGGNDARLIIIPSYDATPKEEKAIIREWKQRKVASVDVARTRSRDDLASLDLVSKIRTATGVWFTGGQQAIPADYYSGTDIELELYLSGEVSLVELLRAPPSCLES